MQRDIASSLAAVGIAAAIVLPSTYAAQSQSYRDDRPALSINQSVDRADARIAALKADLRLTDDQARNWGSLEIALHDIAIKRAKSSVEKSDSQTGRSAARTTGRPSGSRRPRCYCSQGPGRRQQPAARRHYGDAARSRRPRSAIRVPAPNLQRSQASLRCARPQSAPAVSCGS